MRIPTKRLRVELASAESEQVITIPAPSDADSRYQLEIDFGCTMTTKPETNRGSLTILNLAESTRNLLSGVISERVDFPPVLDIGIDNSAGVHEPKLVSTSELFPQGFTRRETIRLGDAYVTVDAGEDQFVGRVFEGSGRPIIHEWDGGTWRTNLAIVDSLTTRLAGTGRGDFPPNARLYDVVLYLVRAMGLEAGNLTPTQLQVAVGANVGSYFPRGYRVIGDSVPILNDLLHLTGAEWWSDRGKFYVVREGQPVNAAPIVVEPDDGLRAQPRPEANGSVSLSMDFRRDLRVGWPLELRTRRLAGLYRVEEVSHRLNNRAGEWASFALLRRAQTIPGVF